MNFFFYGTLCHDALLTVVLGRAVKVRPATLANQAVFWAEGAAYPLIRSAPGSVAHGLLLEAVTEVEAARLDHYEGGFGYTARVVPVQAGRETVMAHVYFPDNDDLPAGPAWVLADWVTRYGPAAQATARDFMGLMGQVPANVLAARYGAMFVRGASAVRAEGPQKATLRRFAQPEDIRVEARALPYARFFALEEWLVAWRQFDGAMNNAVERAVFVSCDAVTVLPYDPVRDRVLLIEQFRAGPMARGDAGAWQLEAVAGRIDPGETPQEAARREAMEEAGLRLDELLAVSEYYSSPGIATEFLFSYVGLVDLPDGVAGVFGQEEEAEDIRGHVIAFDQMMHLVATGEIANAPLILTALWLQRERGRIRVTAGIRAPN